jgi:hypothetical protein
MYFPRNWEFGSALSKLRNFGGGGGWIPQIPLRYATAHNRHTTMPPGGIRTPNPNRRATADPRLRPRGHWDRIKSRYLEVIGKVTPLQARCGPEAGRGIALLFHDLGTRRRWMVSVTPRPQFAPVKDSVPILHEAGWAPGSVWRGAENLAPHRHSIPGQSSP